MKIIVAGGGGYVGSKLVPELLEHGYEVEIIDLFWFGHIKYNNSKISLTKKNLFDCTREDFKGAEQFIFLAGLSNDPMAEYSPSKNFRYNAALPAYLAYECKQVGVKRFIYASSCSIYGYTVDELYGEDSPITCQYPYGISKYQGELGVNHFADKDFSVISLRKGTVCGYSPRMRFDLIVNTMFKNALVNGKITVSNPSIWRPLLDIRDAVSAYIRAVQANYAISGSFNIASDNYTVGQVADMVKQETEKINIDKIELELNNIQDFRNYKVTCAKAKTRLGYFPQYNIIDMIHDLFDHIREYGDMNQPKYYNIEVFKQIEKGRVWN